MNWKISLRLCGGKRPAPHVTNEDADSTPPIPSGLVDDYNAASLGLGHGANVMNWPSDEGTDVLISKYTGVVGYPTFDAAAFNGLGGVKYDHTNLGGNFDVLYSESTNDITFFPSEEGTFLVVFKLLTDRGGSALMVQYGSGSRRYYVSSITHANRPFYQTVIGFGPLESPAANLPLNQPNLFLTWRDGGSLGFRRDGVLKSGQPGPDPGPTFQPVAKARWWGDSSNGNSLDVTVARIMRWERLLTDQEKQDVETVLMGMYF